MLAGFDGGDCCSCTCETGLYTCGSGGYACLDLAADCAEPSTSFTDDTSETYRSCSDSSFSAGDGYCNDAFNIRDCGESLSVYYPFERTGPFST